MIHLKIRLGIKHTYMLPMASNTLYTGPSSSRLISNHPPLELERSNHSHTEHLSPHCNAVVVEVVVG